MRKLLILSFLLFSFCGFAQEKSTATLYYSLHCKHCLDLKADFLPKMKEKYKDRILWREVMTNDNPDGLKELIAVSNYFKRDVAKVPAIMVGDRLLVGTIEILPGLDNALGRSLGSGSSAKIESDIDMVKVFHKIPFTVIAFSGLVDGINPCAFAVIIFFVSFLAVYGYRRKEMVYVGCTYCVAVFIAYFLIGLGLFKFLYSISHIHILIKTFYYLVGIFCFSLAGLALYDFYQYKRTGSSKDQLLQLPGFLKKRINIVIGSHLRDKKKKTPIQLMISAFLVGFIVSLLEAVCTGQVYIPIIVSILKYPHLRAKAIFYLFIYNIMFIMPLIVVFVLSFIGFNSKVFDSFLKSHLGAIKILLAIVFAALGFFVIGYEYIYTYILPFLRSFVVQ
jgi:hypothetical protein